MRGLSGWASSAAAEEAHPDNPRIVTTAAEKKLLELARAMLGGIVPDDDIQAKDTESYYAILYQGKTNRWLLRYAGDRNHPVAHFPIDLTDDDEAKLKAIGLERGSGNSVALEKPEHVTRLGWLLLKSLDYCRNDENFKKGKSDAPAA